MKISSMKMPSAILVEIGRRAKEMRLQHNLTQSELAKELGLSRSAIQNLERGQNTRLETLIGLLRVTGSLDKLDTLLPEHSLRPSDAIKLGKSKRQRGTGTRSTKKTPPTPSPTLRWHDEQNQNET